MSPPTKRMKSTKRVESSKPTTGIDDLPPEMVCELFKYLHPKDLAACSRVNKRWHSIYADFKVQRLFVSEERNFRVHQWYPFKRTVEDHQLIWPELFGRLVDRPLLSYLKYLALRDVPSEFDLNRLNSFGQLLHLEIYIRGVTLNLKLPKLKVLSIRYDRSLLSIDCPQLSVLRCHGPDNESLFDVKHPETIKKLETVMSGSELRPFKNVVCLVTNRFNSICKDTLLSLPALKALHWNGVFKDLFPLIGEVRTLEEMKRALNEFMNNARLLRGDDFQLRFAGFQLTKTMLKQIDFGVKVNESFGRREEVHNEYVYMKNYHLIDSDDTLDFIDREVNYTRLLEVTGEIPSDFSKRFVGIRNVITTYDPVKSETHFLWFLKSVRSLQSLKLCTKLSQEFYDQLPSATPSMTYLALLENRLFYLDVLDFHFIDGFSDLCLQVTYPLPLETLELILGKIESGFFNFGTSYQFSKDRGGVWELFDYHWLVDPPRLRTENPAEIINFLRKHQDI